ncbi:MAG: ABC transporter substrate-binding protein, partial [bacterium]
MLRLQINKTRPVSGHRVQGLILAVALLALAGCKSGPGSNDAGPAADIDLSPATGGAILEGSIGDASNLIPMLAGDSSSHSVASLVFDPLLTYDRNQDQLEPRLASSWEVSEDGLEILFHLREDVRWQDGEPFTARDIEYGFKTITDPTTLTAYAEDYRQVSVFEVIDDFTFKVTYDKPFAPALASWNNLVVLPRHLLEGRDINSA